ncbi:hypothetical protein FEM33_25350 [Dyadobacter flavalbus]|uniref:Uncharacterized protein n=1 Tax=Dyadobacter flavalbus TaxID=2579942 RepID=A0A5M8Q381_9BACT|nr:hypothetical protein [Dyadobacter flavalbus]KAA6430337.1 hypothetical protein FEM33_25350 [Dyadobacter flavalbus]
MKGRQGFQIGQTLSFGEYKTSKVKRGWTFSYAIPFIVKFQGAKEKLSFQQFGTNNKAADVALVSRFKETEFEPIKDYFSVALKYKNYFAGSIKLNSDENSWDFIVHNVDGTSRSIKNNQTIGFVRNRQTQIDIIGIRELEGSSALITQGDVYGYEFQMDGKVIGAVSVINNGKVWIRENLDGDLKLVLASISSGLMLRNSVEESTLSMN